MSVQEVLPYAFLADPGQLTHDKSFLRRELDDLLKFEKVGKLDHTRVVALLHHDRQWCDDNELSRHHLRAPFGPARVIFYRHEPVLQGLKVSDQLGNLGHRYPISRFLR